MPIPILDDAISYGRLAWSTISGLWRFSQRNKRKLTPQQKLGLRLKWKPVCEAYIAKQNRERLSLEVIVRDMRRLDNYPNLSDKEKGISAWFKADMLYTYERGIMLGLSWEELKVVDEDKLRFCNWKERGDITLMRTGFVPFECIESIDWDGDRYYGTPHVFCYFDQLRGQPYERIAFCREGTTAYSTFWSEVADYEGVRKLSKRLGVRRWPDGS